MKRSNNFKNYGLALLTVASLAVAGSRPAAAQVFDIKDLGTLAGTDSYAYGVNHRGQVVGVTVNAATAYWHAVLWDTDQTPHDLGALPDAGGLTAALAISDHGQVAMIGDHHPGSGDYTAHRFTPGSSRVEDLGKLPGHYGSWALGINESGQVAGESVLDNTHTRAIRYTNGIGLADMGDLGGTRNSALGINNRGDAVGYAWTPGMTENIPWNPGHAFLYTDGLGRMRDLNDFIPGTLSWELRKANAINDDGAIVGYGWRRSTIRAFFFQDGHVKDLGTFSSGGISYALGLDDWGNVAGTAYLDPSGRGNYRACLFHNGYSPRAGAVNLNSLIAAGSGWTLREATGINGRGLVVGWGEYRGHVHAFLLTQRVFVKSVEVGGNVILGGHTVTGRVTMNRPAPYPVVIALHADDPVVRVPGSVTIPAGATVKTFPVRANTVSADTDVTLYATFGTMGQAVSFQVQKPRPH